MYGMRLPAITFSELLPLSVSRGVCYLVVSLLLLSCSGREIPDFHKVPASECMTGSPEEWPDAGRYAIGERQFDRFAERLAGMPPEDAAAAISAVYDVADSLSLEYDDVWTLENLSGMFADSFFMSDSPLYDEDIYLAVLEKEISCKAFSGKERLRAEWLRNLLSANRVGSEVADLPLLSEDGQDTTLHSVLAGKRTLIYIYGSSCSLCRKLTSELRSSVPVRDSVRDGRLQVISIFAGDDMDVFGSMSRPLRDIAENYIDADSSIAFRNVFDARLVPSLYLVSDDGKVEIKAAENIGMIEKIL